MAKYKYRNEIIKQLTSEIARQIEIVESEFIPLADIQLLRNTDAGGWSIVQNLEHLNFYFDYYLPAIEERLKRISSFESADKYKSSWLGQYFIDSMNYRKGRKIKALKAYVPDSKLDCQSVLDAFLKNQRRFLELIVESAGHDLKAVKIPISITKWIKISLGDTLEFITMHNERHMNQAIARLSLL